MDIPIEVQIFREFKFVRLLNEDTRTKSVNLLGRIKDQDAIIVAEKTAFNTSPELLSSFQEPKNLSALSILGKNDIYHWFLASHSSPNNDVRPEIKFTLIYPASETHIRKYSKQMLRMVTETPEIYRTKVLPYVESKRENGRLNWVYNILEHKAEEERIVYEDSNPHEGFILLPDLKWDQKTMTALYMMTVVHRRDIRSLRDLKKRDAAWLKKMGQTMLKAICEKYDDIEPDQIKLYIHYQPSYYHFHIHAVSVSHDGGFGQTAGKAFLLGNVVSQLEAMPHEEDGFGDIDLEYIIGEESELWQLVFSKLK